MHHLRFSKYDIKYRNELGHYLRDDWTSISDVGKVCEDELLTMEEYEKLPRCSFRHYTNYWYFSYHDSPYRLA